MSNSKLSFGKPIGIMFHHFHGEGHPAAQGSISANQFETLLNAVGLNNILAADEWVSCSTTGTLPADAICLTFDDNLLCQYDIALPVLRRLGITAFWNINTTPLIGIADKLEIYRYFRVNCFPSIEIFYNSFFSAIELTSLSTRVKNALTEFDPKTYMAEHRIYTDQDRAFRYVRDEVLGRESYVEIMDGMIQTLGLNQKTLLNRLWMSIEHIRDLANTGHMIGLHTHSHPTRLDLISPSAQLKEYQDNHKILFDILQKPIISMSHPNGRYTPLVLEFLTGLGIQVGFKAVPSAGSTLLEQPRYDHSELITSLGL